MWYAVPHFYFQLNTTDASLQMTVRKLAIGLKVRLIVYICVRFPLLKTILKVKIRGVA